MIAPNIAAAITPDHSPITTHEVVTGTLAKPAARIATEEI